MANAPPRRSTPAVRQPRVFRAPQRPDGPNHRPVQPDRDCTGVVATEFSYRKDEEIYGEGEPSEYVYQVICGSVRTDKLNDGRRQIGAFYLPGDVFGLDSGPTHRLTAEAIADTTVRLVKRRNLEAAAGSNVKVAHNLLTMTASELRHAEDHMLLLGRKTAMEKWRPSCWKWIVGSPRPA